MNFHARKDSKNYTDLEVTVRYSKITHRSELYAGPEGEPIL